MHSNDKIRVLNSNDTENLITHSVNVIYITSTGWVSAGQRCFSSIYISIFLTHPLIFCYLIQSKIILTCDKNQLDEINESPLEKKVGHAYKMLIFFQDYSP